DGLLEIGFPGQRDLVPVLVEIETYPDQEHEEQVLRDLAAVLLDRRVLPDVVTVVLHPKGEVRLSGQQRKQSRLRLTELTWRWHVIELWTVPAADLLAAGDVGLLPWLPLAHSEEPPEALLQVCRERIEQQARPEERANLLAVAQVMAQLRYN